MAWRIFLQPDEVWESMLGDCERAEKTIDFEQYIFENDIIGNRFIDVFTRKAKQGVRVRMICDMVGSYYFYNSAAYRKLVDDGVEIQFFNPIQPWRISNISSWFFRDHRKVLIVDNAIGYTGGVGIHERMKLWRDTHVRTDDSDIIEKMSYAYARAWDGLLKKRYLRIKKTKVIGDSFNYLTNAPHFRQRFIYHDLLRRISRAKRYIYITTPYFIPDLRFLYTLTKAARKKCDVRLLMSYRSDHPSVDVASQSYFDLLLRSGVRIFLYPERVLHAKTVVIDDVWATVGSTNIDNLSFLFNYESNLSSTDPSFSNAIRNQFLNDCVGAEEVLKDAWRNRSRLQKFLELLSWPFHKFL